MWSRTKNTRKRPCAGFQTKFFRRFKQLGNFLKKAAQRSHDSGRRSRDRRPTVKQVFSTFQAIRKFLKIVPERSRDTFLLATCRNKDYIYSRQRSLNITVTLMCIRIMYKQPSHYSDGHATVACLTSTISVVI